MAGLVGARMQQAEFDYLCQSESAQKALDPYCASSGAQSVQAALMAGLGAALNSLTRREYGVFEIGGAFLAGAAWDLEVIA
mgnify:CR=1 FL=1